MYASEIIDINAEVKAPALMLAVSAVEAEYEFQPRGRTWKQDANELQQRKKRYQWNMNDTVFILRELIGMNDSAQPWRSPDQQTLLWSKFGSTVVLKLPFPLKPTEKLPSASSVVSKVQKWVRSTATIKDFNDMVLKEFKEFKGGRRTYDEKVAAAKDVVDLLVGLQLELEDERLRRLKVKEDKEEEIAQDKVVIAIDNNLVLAIVEYSLGVHCISNVLRSGNRELHGINKTTDISGTERYSISQGSNLSGNSLIVHRETGRIEAQIVGNAESMVRVHMSGDLLECTRSLRIIPTENTRERKS